MNHEANTMPLAKASSYTTAIVDMLPLFGLAFSIVMLKGLKSLRCAYVGKSYMDRFINIIWTSFIGACLSVGCAAITPLLTREGVSESVTVGIVVFVAVCGVRIVDGMLYKYLHIHLIDTTTLTQDDRDWVKMSDEDKADAMQAWRDKEGEDE